eukprot:CAMPEP_0172502054 /NCGR_PEP_ID=MMETSP1066-20121228/155982_1 /TAXON_ID=671091 /ORGANISM="Coscinodiscus wailesii, Strain CCMP2513" /LENGTH=96 /DNA_ID=CAMNT_0013277159 /DNA_START=426 /DNA_END=716 /DNA_ORIENTATION=+
MPDALERICYQSVILAAGLLLFGRITTGRDLVYMSEDYFGSLEELTLAQIRAAEAVIWLAVLGAFLVLGVQIFNEVDMDGFSGIDVEMCKVLRDFS